MLLPLLVFLLGAGAVMAVYAAVTTLPGIIASRKLDQRLRDVAAPVESLAGDATVVKRAAEGPLPRLDRVVSRSAIGPSLTRLIEQSGTQTTASAVLLMMLASAAIAGLLTSMFVRIPFVPLLAAALGATAPFIWLARRKSSRIRRFEEQFPEALDLLSRAIKAGHAFQTAMGMAADELKEPVGPEFKKAFDQQNYGLPLRDALAQLSQRVPLLDVRFFVTAVLIQRDTGGNLSEILENLAHVVRERFKVLRQVRVHTAHGRFTGYVLVALPAALAIALSMINPDHMALLFHEHMGQLMLVGAVVMQAIGFVWIKKVIKIEV